MSLFDDNSVTALQRVSYGKFWFIFQYIWLERLSKRALKKGLRNLFEY